MQKNYFELFGLEPNFLIDIGQLSAVLRKLLQAVHPDRFASASSQEKMASMQQTTQLNDAFAVLKHPVSRAQYLLQLKTGHDTNKEVTVKDPMFLMQQLELREELESISQRQDFDALMAFSDKLEQQAKSQQQQITTLFEQPELDVKSLESDIYKLQFLMKTLADVELAEDKMMG